MPRDAEFFKAYRTYLFEPAVRRSHTRMFETFHNFIGCNRHIRVIDLGCGAEELRHFDVSHQRYAGIDKEPLGDNIIVGDYTTMSPQQIVAAAGFPPDTFVSLFSSEVCLDHKDKYRLYERLFAEIPGLYFGMVSGFIYRQRSYYYSVTDGGIERFQTIENQFDFVSACFTEFRSYVNVPSKFFGDDVVEVWKFFRKN